MTDPWRLIALAEMQGGVIILAFGVCVLRPPAFRWLAALLFAVAACVLGPMLSAGSDTEMRSVQQVCAATSWLFGPLMLAYVAARTGRKSILAQGRWVVHVLLPLLAGAGLVWLSRADQVALMAIWAPVSFGIYAIAALSLIHRHENRLRERWAEVGRLSLEGLRGALVAVLTLTVLHILAALAGQLKSQDALVLNAGIGMLMAALASLGPRGSPRPEIAIEMPQTELESDSSGRSDAEPRLGEPALSRLLVALDRLDGRPELLFDHQLSLDRLAVALGVTAHQLSWALNHARGTRFYEFINRLRVEAVQARLRDPQNAATPILDLALACGFSTKTTFNKSFKAYSGCTPSHWRAEHNPTRHAHDGAPRSPG
jgi:AraC-like DNA-binding protein